MFMPELIRVYLAKIMTVSAQIRHYIGFSPHLYAHLGILVLVKGSFQERMMVWSSSMRTTASSTTLPPPTTTGPLTAKRPLGF